MTSMSVRAYDDFDENNKSVKHVSFLEFTHGIGYSARIFQAQAMSFFIAQCSEFSVSFVSFSKWSSFAIFLSPNIYLN